MSDNKFHFFASSVGEWRTGVDLKKLMKVMDSGGLRYNVFYVPGPADAEYKINMYAPQVKGTVFLGCYDKKGLVPDEEN